MPGIRPVFDLWRANNECWTISGIWPRRSHATRARPARRLALAQADDQLLAQLADRQGIDRVIDRLTTDVGIS